MELLLALTACHPPAVPPPPPTRISVVVRAGPRSNGGAPLSLRIYQLASPAAFDRAQFTPLFTADRALLEGDLIRRDDAVVVPGQSKTIALSPTDRVAAIGVVGAFRDYETLTWRTAAAVPAHRSSVLTVVSGASGLSGTLLTAP